MLGHTESSVDYDIHGAACRRLVSGHMRSNQKVWNNSSCVECLHSGKRLWCFSGGCFSESSIWSDTAKSPIHLLDHREAACRVLGLHIPMVWPRSTSLDTFISTETRSCTYVHISASARAPSPRALSPSSLREARWNPVDPSSASSFVSICASLSGTS